MRFDGETYDEQRDSERLSSLMERVTALMLDGQWRTLAQIAQAVGSGSEASISARLRDLRKPQYGEHVVEGEHVSDGLWRYRVVPRAVSTQHEAVTLEAEPPRLFEMSSEDRRRAAAMFDVD